MINKHEAVGGMRIGKANRSTWRKPAPMPFCPPQIPHDVTWERIRAPFYRTQHIKKVILHEHSFGVPIQ
jgi:hypothetical protein